MPSLPELVKALPEVYQPIFGHPELSPKTSRGCEDRLTIIAQLYDDLAKKLGRPLRVLDLGCAQGWFSLQLAAKGASVLGVDIIPENVAVCSALGLAQAGQRAKFELNNIETVAERIKEGEFDLVLGLSVFHHLCAKHGKAYVRTLIELLLMKIGFAIIEFARPDEPLEWAASLPASPLYFLEEIPFYSLLSWHDTHLSDLPRPLYCASRSYWYLGGSVEKIEAWTLVSQPMAGVQDKGRRYFMSGDKVAKLYQAGEENETAIAQEAAFLAKPPAGLQVPKLYASGQTGDAAWLIRERLPGVRLIDTIMQRQPYDVHKVLGDILRQLAVLEDAGLAHSDVRTWNVLMNNGEALLIDYDSITAKQEDCTWPNDPFLSFLIFVQEVTTGDIRSDKPMRAPFISPHNLPPRYRGWAMKLWNLPRDQWSFRFLLANLDQPSGAIETSAMAIWEQAMERHLNLMHEVMCTVDARLTRLEENLFDGGSRQSSAQAGGVRPSWVETDLRKKTEILEQSNNSLKTELERLHASTSWRATAPLRSALTLARKILK